MQRYVNALMRNYQYIPVSRRLS